MPVSTIGGFKTYIRDELGLSQETLLAYTKDVQEFFDFIKAQELTAQSVEKFISHLQKREFKSTTIRRKYMSIRCLCHHLISLNRLDPNILNMVDSIRIERNKPDALESSDVDALISAIKNRSSLLRTTNIRRDVAIILTLYHSGLRASELCNLNIGDINFARREIKVSGKGGRDRIVPTTEQCVEAIQEYIKSDRETTADAIFVKSDGQKITRRSVSGMLTSLSCRAGIKNVTAHTLRRSCATSLMNNGMDLELVQTILGHQNLSTTQSYLAISYNRLKNIHAQYHPFGDRCVKTI